MSAVMTRAGPGRRSPGPFGQKMVEPGTARIGARGGTAIIGGRARRRYQSLDGGHRLGQRHAGVADAAAPSWPGR